MKRPRRTLPLFRCDRCRLTLYGPPNGVTEGQRCAEPIIAEWHPIAGVLMTQCFGTFEEVGTVTLAKAS